MAGINHPEFARYQGSGYSNVMGWGSRPALLLVDVCKAYWTEGSPLDLRANPAAAAAPDSMRRLLTAARESGVPIIWTQGHYTSPTMADAGLFFLKAKMLDISLEGDKRGLNGWLEGLEPKAKEPLIKKQFPSAFFGTTLASQLHLLNVDTLVICGVSTSGCIRASTLDAMCNGFRPMVVGAACGDRTPEIQNANLFDLNAKYADVVSEDEAIIKLKVGWI